MRKQASYMVNNWIQSNGFKEFIFEHNNSKEMKENSRKTLLNNTKAGNCVKCGKFFEIRSSSGMCSKCLGEIYNISFCKECEDKTPHKGNICLICHPESRGINNINYYIEKDPNCEMHKGCKNMYFDDKIKKYICWECYKNEWQNNNNMNLINKCKCLYCGTIINPNDLFCSDKCKLDYFKNYKRYKFDFKNNLVIDKLEQKEISWEEFKSKFQIQNLNFNLYNEFKVYCTFRTQYSDDWSGAKAAFEQSLVDDNIGWFIYIKFYFDKENKLKPLVCGKSGSLLVNINGSDVSFDYNPNGGPARQFLIEENLKWDKTKIAILKCESEKEAYLAEQKYLREFNLFGS